MSDSSKPGSGAAEGGKPGDESAPAAGTPNPPDTPAKRVPAGQGPAGGPVPGSPANQSPDPTSASPARDAAPVGQTGTTGRATPVADNESVLDGTPAAAQPASGAATQDDSPPGSEKAARPPIDTVVPPAAGPGSKPAGPDIRPAAPKPTDAAGAAGEANAPAVARPAAETRPKPDAPARPAAAEKPAPPPRAPDPPIIAELRARFGEAIVEAAVVDEKPNFVVDREKMVEFAAAVQARGFDYPACISGVDWPDTKAPEKSFRETVYHIRSMKTGEWVVIKARCPSSDPWLNSLTSVYRNADWNEREIYDLYGIVFRGHPDLRRILMPEDWTGHPLLKSYRMSTYYSPAGTERQK